MKLSHLIITFAAINISACTVDSTQEKTISDGPLDLYDSEHKVTLYSKTKPQRKAAGAFNRFKKGDKGYFGAFAYSLGGGAYSGVDGYNSLKTATEGALASCSIYNKKGDTPCKIIAVLTPRGYVDKQKITLSKNATKDFRDQKGKGKYRAFATNDAGYYSFVWEYETQDLANRSALQNCSIRVKTKTPRHQKIYKCHLIPEE